MEFSDGKSPRRSSELQGPRPTPLKLHRDSHKITKNNKPPLPPRHPIIIYTVSPKIIHTTPSDFMSLVQRLTGPSSSPSLSSTSHDLNNDRVDDDIAAVSPAARFASIEKAMSPPQANNAEMTGGAVEAMERPTVFHGTLSPGPASLSPIPSSFFLPTTTPATVDPSVVGLFHDLSPVLHSGRNFMEGGLVPSPSTNYFVSLSPRTPSIDLFNNFFN